MQNGMGADAGANRRFACPGLFRVVPSRDGGICRIKLSRGRVTAAQLRAIADAARATRRPPSRSPTAAISRSAA